jgi:hypothetical protein
VEGKGSYDECVPRGCEEEEGQRKKLKTASPGRADKVHVYRIQGARCIIL